MKSVDLLHDGRGRVISRRESYQPLCLSFSLGMGGCVVLLGRDAIDPRSIVSCRFAKRAQFLFSSFTAKASAQGEAVTVTVTVTD